MPSNLLRSLLTTPGPAVAVSITPEQVAAAHVEVGAAWAAGAGARAVAAPAGAVTPAVQGANLADPPAVAAAVEGALNALPRRPRRIALLLPDAAAKVSMVRFASAPVRSADLDPMLRWQVRKTVPFDVDEAQMDWMPGRTTAAGEQEFVAVLAQRAVVEEYEHVCTAAGTHAGLVNLLSFSLLDAAVAYGEAASDGDWLLVHVGVGSTTLAVVRDRYPLLFRTVADGQPLGDLVHQAAMYYEDKLAGDGLSHALVACNGGTPQGVEEVRRVVEDRLSIAVEPIAKRLTRLLPEENGLDVAALDGLAAPLGLLLRQFAEQAPD